MCLVWRGGPSSWNIWTRSVPRSSLLRSSHLDMGSSSLLTITPGCSSIPSIQLELSSPAHSGMQLDPIKPARPPGLPGQPHLAEPPSQSHLAQGSGAASGAQALHQQDQRSALARCRKTQFFLHALFFYISFYASPLVNAQFRACNQCRKESSPKSLGSLPCTLPFS